MPTWEEWDQGTSSGPASSRAKRRRCSAGRRSPRTRTARCYRGVAENSIYVARSARGRGVGRALLRRALPPGARGPDLDAAGEHPRRERGVDRAARRLRLPDRRHPREARPQARRVERRRADGAPLSRARAAPRARPTEGRPALLVRVRLVVQVLPHSPQSPAQSGRQRILSGSASATASRPHCRQVDPVAVVRTPSSARRRRDFSGGLVFADVDRHLEHGVAEAAVARPVQARRERMAEHRAGVRPVTSNAAGTVSGTGM